MGSESTSWRHTCSWVTNTGVYQEWDVFRLWKSAAGLPITEVALADLLELRDPEAWLTYLPDTTHPKVAGEMGRIEEADPAYPILVHPEDWVMDGYHRIAKAFLAGSQTIQAVKFTGASLPLPDIEIPNCRRKE